VAKLKSTNTQHIKRERDGRDAAVKEEMKRESMDDLEGQRHIYQ
jgi:hypothetical protein